MVMQKKGSSEGHVGFVTNITYTDNETMEISSLGGNQDNKVCIQKYTFKKVGDEWIYKGKFVLKGFVVPKEYEYNSDEYYEYDEQSEKEGGTVK
jgi:hypothetical protein